MGGFGSILDQPTRGQTQADIDAALAARGPGPSIGPATPQPTTPDALAAARAALFLQGLTRSEAPSTDPNSLFNGPNRYNPTPTLPGAQPADAASSRGVLHPSRPMGYDDYMKLADMAAGTIGLTPPHPNMTPGERLQNIAAVGSLGLGPLMESFQLSKLAGAASDAMKTGGTFDVATGKALTGSGYLVADPEFTRTILPHENQRGVIKAFLQDPQVRQRLAQGDSHLGVYTNPDGLPEVSVTDRVTGGESAARDLARTRGQNSFGHLVDGEYQGDVPTKRDFTGRRVTGTALRDVRGNIYQRPLPSTHAHVLADVPPGTGLESRGFVLDNGTFVSPEEAMDVAEQQSQVVPGRFERTRTGPRDLHAFDLKENQPRPPAPSYKVEDEGPQEHLANAQSILNMHADMHGAHTSLEAGDLGAVADRVRKAGHSLTLTPQTTVGDLQAQLRGMMAPTGGEVQPLEDVASGIRSRAGLMHEPLPPVGKVDPEAGAHMAQTYSQLENAPNDPQVQGAYRKFVSETAAQAQALRKAGYSWEFTDKDPYGSSAEMLQDLNDNHHIKVLKTQPGQGHPLLSNDENNEFRAVHDILGHGSTGASFGPRGEEQAYRNHSALYSPESQRVLATETRGQNSWFNYGPQSHLPVKERPFAQQKAALFPANLTGDYPDVRKAALLDLPEGAPSVLGASDYSYGARTPEGRQGTVLPEQDVTPLAQAVAHHTAGTTDKAGFLANLQQHEPGLAGLDKSAPGVMDRLYDAAKTHQKFAEGARKLEDQ